MTHILLIDDNTDFCDVYRDILTRDGYEVSVAYDGPSGLEKIDCNDYDILFLDIMMEPMDGWEVLKNIRKREECADLNVVILTAKAIFPEDVLEYGDMLQGIVMKPVYSSQLKECLEKILEEKRKLKEELSKCGDDDAACIRAIERSRLKSQIAVLEKTKEMINDRFNMKYANQIPELLSRIEKLKEKIDEKKAAIEELS